MIAPLLAALLWPAAPSADWQRIATLPVPTRSYVRVQLGDNPILWEGPVPGGEIRVFLQPLPVPGPVPNPNPGPTPTPTPSPQPSPGPADLFNATAYAKQPRPRLGLPIIFGVVVDPFGRLVTHAGAGAMLRLLGDGFPNEVLQVGEAYRLTVAGREVGVSAWTGTVIEWFLPGTATEKLTAPVSGVFEVWKKSGGQWTSLGQGGFFTVDPPQRPAGTRQP